MVKTLDGTEYAWLVEVLTAFNEGDLEAYEKLCVKCVWNEVDE